MNKSFSFFKNVVTFLILIFSFSASLIAQTPQYYNYNSTAGANLFPFAIPAGKQVQWLFYKHEWNTPSVSAPGNIDTLYIMMASTASVTLTDLTIKMGLTTITSLPSGVIYTGPLDTVYFRASVSLSSTFGQWMRIPLDRPYNYTDTSKNIIIDISQCGATTGTMYVAQTSLAPIRRTAANHTGSCTFSESYQGGEILNSGVHISPALPHLCEGFNSTDFPPAGWTNTNTTLIYRSPVSGFQMGSGSAYFDFWNVVSGTGDLTTLTFIPSVSGDSVQFTLAHCPFGAPDDILLQGSTNGGTTFTTIFDMTSVWMQTTTGCTRPFIPSAAGQWQRRGFSVPVGTNKIRFHATTAFGDGAYIDSVCVTHVPLGIRNNNNSVPKVYSLSQNYPNPFNPITLINYTLPKAGNVELRVYDLVGREVAVLVNGFKQVGNYSVEFKADNFASGVYFYKIISGDFVETKKMMLVK